MVAPCAESGGRRGEEEEMSRASTLRIRVSTEIVCVNRSGNQALCARFCKPEQDFPTGATMIVVKQRILPRRGRRRWR